MRLSSCSSFFFRLLKIFKSRQLLHPHPRSFGPSALHKKSKKKDSPEMARKPKRILGKMTEALENKLKSPHHQHLITKPLFLMQTFSSFQRRKTASSSSITFYLFLLIIQQFCCLSGVLILEIKPLNFFNVCSPSTHSPKPLSRYCYKLWRLTFNWYSIW